MSSLHRWRPWLPLAFGAAFLVSGPVTRAAPEGAATETAARDDAERADGRCEDGGFVGDWPRADPASLAVDEARLEAAVDALAELRGTRRVLVARDGRVVRARSWRGSLTDSHDVKSASKSLLGTVVGAAVDRGLVGGLDTPLRETFPVLGAADAPAEKRGLRLRHLLSMSSGLASTSGEHYGAWVAHDDWVAAALARPVVADPGARFIYSTGNTHVVSALLTDASGASTRALAERLVLDPIGARVAAWARSPEGIDFGGNSVRMSAPDLARLGQLHLDGGRWCGRAVVSPEWIGEATRRHAEGWPDRYGAYGLTWWLPGQRAGEPPGHAELQGTFLAVGYGGQFLLVSPRHDAVVVLFSDHEGKGAAWDRKALELLGDGILGAMR